jgi:hypothetical protein
METHQRFTRGDVGLLTWLSSLPQVSTGLQFDPSSPAGPGSGPTSGLAGAAKWAGAGTPSPFTRVQGAAEATAPLLGGWLQLFGRQVLSFAANGARQGTRFCIHNISSGEEVYVRLNRGRLKGQEGSGDSITGLSMMANDLALHTNPVFPTCLKLRRANDLVMHSNPAFPTCAQLAQSQWLGDAYKPCVSCMRQVGFWATPTVPLHLAHHMGSRFYVRGYGDEDFTPFRMLAGGTFEARVPIPLPRREPRVEPSPQAVTGAGQKALPMAPAPPAPEPGVGVDKQRYEVGWLNGELVKAVLPEALVLVGFVDYAMGEEAERTSTRGRRAYVAGGVGVRLGFLKLDLAWGARRSREPRFHLGLNTD